MASEALDFPTTDEYPKIDLKRGQERLLEMARLAHAIFKANGIRYIIYAGTLLGAVRHQGYIPWDDDFDMFVFADDYERAVDCLRRELPEWIVVQDQLTEPDYLCNWSKLRDRFSETWSTMYPSDNEWVHRGLCLDVYRMEQSRRSDLGKLPMRRVLKEFSLRRTLVAKAKGVVRFLLCLPRYLFAGLRGLFDREEIIYELLEAPRMSAFRTTAILPLKNYRFEDAEFYGPHDAHSVLREMFGDYMCIPPYEQRRPHYAYVKFLSEGPDGSAV